MLEFAFPEINLLHTVGKVEWVGVAVEIDWAGGNDSDDGAGESSCGCSSPLGTCSFAHSYPCCKAACLLNYQSSV